VIVNYVDYEPGRACSARGGQADYCHPNSFPGSVATLFRNRGRPAGADGKAVRFEDVTVSAGLGRKIGPGLGVVCADFNGDRWPDLFVANDSKPNHLWINQRDGTFKEEAVPRGVAYNGLGQAQANMGIALGDVDGDQRFDLFVTHLTEETHALWRQERPGQFRDRTAAAGLASGIWRGTGFGTAFVDFDHDGALDLALANGRVMRASSAGAGHSFWSWYTERNQLFANDGTGRFRDISPVNAPLCGSAAVSRALVYGDVDNDGAVDLLVTAAAGPARLYRNVVPNRGRWLLLRAVDPALGGRDAYGAEITVTAGKSRWVRWLNPGSSYLCSHDPRVHVGLGSAERVDAVRVVWPDGSEETFAGQAADQTVVLRKGTGQK
jgi:hypothetical protein